MDLLATESQRFPGLMDDPKKESPHPLSFDAFAFLFHDPTFAKPRQQSHNTPRHA
jgi:hypothetical protein